MRIGRYFFITEFPFCWVSNTEFISVADILVKHPDFPKVKISKADGNIIIKPDYELVPHMSLYECVLSEKPLMLKSYKSVYMDSVSEGLWTTTYEFSGEMTLPWNGVKIPSKIVMTSFDERDGTGHRAIVELKSIKLEPGFDIKNYDLPPEKGWTFYDRIKGAVYEVGDSGLKRTGDCRINGE